MEECRIWRRLAILRVITGTARGHKLKTLKGYTSRPTSGRVKESIFNIITEYLADACVLDLFAGSGNLGIEALSRGAAQAVFVEKNEPAASVIRENLVNTKLDGKGAVIRGDVLKVLYNLSKDDKRFDIIFLDPPYNRGLLDKSLDIIEREGLLRERGIIVAERSSLESTPAEMGDLRLVKDRIYGNTAVAFYSRNGKLL